MNSHIVRVRDLSLLVSNDGELQVAARNLVNVLDPALMAVDGVRGEANELRAALAELGLKLCEGAELSSAYGCVIFRMGEEDDPVVANELCSLLSMGNP